MSPETVAAGIAVAFLAALCQSVTGFGFALVMTPLMALAWEPKLAVATSLLLSPISVSMMLPEVRGRIPVSRVSVLFLGFLIGMPPGVVLLDRLDADALRIAIAAVVVVAAVLLYFAPGITGQRDGFLIRLAVGAVSGAIGTSASMGGPPIVLYLINRERDIESFRATTLALFLPTSLLAFGAAAIIGVVTADVFVMVGVAIPSVVLGLLLGASLRRHVKPERFRPLVLAVLVLTSASVFLSSSGALG
ncbi:MAG TPA: sulfite exporter TauE/SafE family protein [Dehalococcoidia bacterium]|nr:sulfite exporter TauE/SafE family protein [Dehalococcoidia bacterium]